MINSLFGVVLGDKGVCTCCGDSASAWYKGRDYCLECIAEVLFGVIPIGTVPLNPGNIAPLRVEDEEYLPLQL